MKIVFFNDLYIAYWETTSRKARHWDLCRKLLDFKWLPTIQLGTYR